MESSKAIAWVLHFYAISGKNHTYRKLRLLLELIIKIASNCTYILFVLFDVSGQ